MTDPRVLTPTVTVVVDQPAVTPLLQIPGDVDTPPVTETLATVEVTIKAPHPASVLLNAAALAADYGLRAIDKDHPAHAPAQCGRTFVHALHQTTEGWCPGLDAKGVAQAIHEEAEAARGQDTLPEEVAPVVIRLPEGTDLARVEVVRPPADGAGVVLIPHNVDVIDFGDVTAQHHRADRYALGLTVLATRGCENRVSGDCWDDGRTADAEHLANRACAACVAQRVLDGGLLPTEEGRNRG